MFVTMFVWRKEDRVGLRRLVLLFQTKIRQHNVALWRFKQSSLSQSRRSLLGFPADVNTRVLLPVSLSHVLQTLSFISSGLSTLITAIRHRCYHFALDPLTRLSSLSPAELRHNINLLYMYSLPQFGVAVISLWHCWGGMEAQVYLTVAFSSSAFFGLLFLIFLLTIPHRFSLLASQAHQHHGHLTNFWCFWQCGQEPNPHGKWNQHL